MKLSKKAQTSLEKAVERFKTGDLSPVIEIATLRRDPPVPFDTWSYRNRVIAYAQADDTDLRNFNAWKEVGRHVKKDGTASAYILQPVKVPIKNDDGETAGWKVVNYRPLAEFAIDQTEGEPLPEPEYTRRELPPLAEVAERLGIPIKYVPNIPAALGDTDGKRIHLATGDHKVFFHELAHALHTHLDGGERKGDTAYRETVAEFTACVLSDMYGYDRSGNAWSYISQYNKDPIEAINKAMITVQKILEYLFPSETEGK